MHIFRADAYAAHSATANENEAAVSGRQTADGGRRSAVGIFSAGCLHIFRADAHAAHSATANENEAAVGGRQTADGGRRSAIGIFSAAWREWLLITPFVALVIAYIFYWIGSPVRLWGPRYYFEGFAVLWIVSAVGLLRLWDWGAGRSRRWLRPALMGVVGAMLIANLGVNLPGRLAQVQALYGRGRAMLAPVVEADLHNALVFVSGDHWRDYGAFLAQMGPLLDDDILYPTIEGPEQDAAVIADFPGREVYRLEDGELKPWVDTPVRTQ